MEKNWTTLHEIVKNVRPTDALLYDMRPLLDASPVKVTEINNEGSKLLDGARFERDIIKAEAMRETGNMMLNDSVRELSFRN